MRSSRLYAATAAMGLLSVGFPLAATADTTGTSSATFTIKGGELGISVKTGPTSLGSITNSAEGSSVSGRLGQVVVSDRRNAPAGSGWVATVAATGFFPRKGPALPASRIGYKAGAIEKTGSATYTANDLQNLTRAKAAVTATDVTGDNTATWTPTIHVDIPAGLAAGLYTVTITHSVL